MHGRPNIVPDRRSANIVHTHRTIRLLTTYRAVYRPARTQIKRLHYYRIHPLLPEQYNNFLYSKHTAQKNLLQITLILSLEAGYKSASESSKNLGGCLRTTTLPSSGWDPLWAQNAHHVTLITGGSEKLDPLLCKIKDTLSM